MIGKHLAGIVAALLVAVGASEATRAEPLRIGYAIWVGFGPLFVAEQKGFFAREGLEVELIDMALPEALHAGLLAGQIDVAAARSTTCCRPLIPSSLMSA
jgi:NitT/TauT family transport system substrate-binding protein